MVIAQAIVNLRPLHGCYTKSPRSPRVVGASNVGRGALPVSKTFCLRGESFVLSIVQNPTYAREGWGGAFH